MATIALRVEDDVRDQLVALAAQQGVSVSELLRGSIDELLGRKIRDRREEVPATLSLVQRRTLGLQHEALALLDSEDPEYHQRRVEALYRGFAAEYENEFIGLEPEMPRSEAALLWDILDMFTIIETSIERLSDADRATLGDDRAHWLQFVGFDLADSREGSLLTYARFLIEDDRWTNLAPHFDNKHERGHSHHRTLPHYLTLLELYEPMKRARSGSFSPQAYLLQLDELIKLADAKIDHARWSE